MVERQALAKNLLGAGCGAEAVPDPADLGQIQRAVPQYEPTRRFYLKNGYDQEALVRDYYNDGDSLVIFRKRLDAAT